MEELDLPISYFNSAAESMLSTTSSIETSFSLLREVLVRWSPASDQNRFTPIRSNSTLEPIKELATSLRSQPASLVAKTKQLRNRLLATKSELSEMREAYFSSCVKAEKAKAVALLEDSHKKEFALNNAKAMEELAENASNSYFLTMAQERQHWSEYESCRKNLRESLVNIEDSRIEFMNSTFSRFASILENFLRMYKNLNIKSTSELTDILDMIPEIDPEKWETYEDWKKRQKFDPVLNEESYGEAQMDKNEFLIRSVAHQLGPKDINERFLSQAVEQLCPILSEQKSRISFLALLDLKESFELAPKSFDSLAQIFTFILEDAEALTFHCVTHMTHEFYKLSNKKIYYLYNEVAGNPAFLSKKKWIKAIKLAINDRVQFEKKNTKKKFSVNRAQNNATLHFLRQFISYMSNLGLHLNTATELVLEMSKKTKIDFEKIQSLLIELYGRQKKGIIIQDESSIRKRYKERNKWGNLLVFGLSLKFLSFPELRQTLLVSKTWNTAFKDTVFRYAMLKFHIKSHRKAAWVYSLRPKEDLKYTVVLQVSKQSLVKRDIIDMDIHRSYYTMSEANTAILKNVLSAYSHYNSKVQYCQGMNYLAGTLFKVVNEEALVFDCMSSLIDQFSMDGLYSETLPKLTMYFYVLDRLIKHFLPDVSETLNTEMVSSSHFASPWFLTLYGALFRDEEILLEIWDLFIFKGWKVIFQVAIALIHFLKNRIVGHKFEQIMTLMTNSDNQYAQFSLKQTREFKVTRRMLREIENEYENIKSLV